MAGARPAHNTFDRTSPVIQRFLRGAIAVNRPLALVAAAMAPLFLLTVLGVLVDAREVTGVPAWVKPMKFAASISVYAFTLLWMLGRVRGRARLVWWTAT